MDRNVEIKARIRDFEIIRERVEKYTGSSGNEIYQKDTFFHIESGKLKLRTLSAEIGRLIFYERDDASGPAESTYIAYTTSQPNVLRELLAASLPIRGEVSKHRIHYTLNNLQIHLDKVEGLGEFFELEFELNENQSTDDGIKIVLELMQYFGIHEEDLVSKSYIDLLGSVNYG